MGGAARGAAAGAIGKGERTQRGKVLGEISGHGNLQVRKIGLLGISRGRRETILNGKIMPR